MCQVPLYGGGDNKIRASLIQRIFIGILEDCIHIEFFAMCVFFIYRILGLLYVGIFPRVSFALHFIGRFPSLWCVKHSLNHFLVILSYWNQQGMTLKFFLFLCS